MNVQQLIETVAALAARVEALEKAQPAKRDRGPASEREMTAKDAFRCKFGDLAKANHKAAAEALGLSYGQVYSCRGGYTFKAVKADWTETPAPAADAPKADAPTTEAQQ